MRDDFTAGVKTTLAKRVAYLCSNPACRAVTSGPGSEPDATVNVGVAAHVTAASPGGPRYDASLTAAERRAPSNGIWLCQGCGKLVDSDVRGYTADELRRWKTETEERVRRMLGAAIGTAEEPLALRLPVADDDDFLLSYASTSLEAIGRERELAELRAFLDDDRGFLWWLWTGPAGVGKSRLALELCRAHGAWHAGFLTDREQERLPTHRPVVPTLVVIDYAAQRSQWLSNALFDLAQADSGEKMRVLVLEREAAGSWWETVQRHHRLNEASEVAASMYGLPRELSGLPRETLRVLVRFVAEHLGAGPSTTDIEDICDHAEQIDPDRTPLFALVATMDSLSDSVKAGRDDALRRLGARADAQLARRIGEPAATFRARNAQFLATAIGGTTVEVYTSLLDQHTASVPARLLPDVYDDVHSVALDYLLDGLRPDILGELWVLDRLATSGVQGQAARRLKELAWRGFTDAYAAFVDRAAADHRDHSHLLDLLDVEHTHDPVRWAEVVVSVIPLLRHSEHPAISWIFDRLEATRATCAAGGLDEAIATARFRYGTLVFHEGDLERANALYSEVLDASEPSWRIHASALNNRGITWSALERNDLATADFTSVIESQSASNEMRAMSLNNRADLCDAADDPKSAIADRTAVLALTDTTFNRRYIALNRRARALRQVGESIKAERDIEAILGTDDIAVEQKMAARLARAKWRIADGRPAEARGDIEAVLASRRNFEAVEAEAHELLAEM